MKHTVCVIPEYNTCEGTELSVEFRISMQDTNMHKREFSERVQGGRECNHFD